MPEGINISLSKVSETSSAIRGLNERLTTNLEEIKAQMNNLDSTWESDASRSVRENFNALSPKFDNYREVVDSYAKFLDMTVRSYQETETAINSNANAFK